MNPFLKLLMISIAVGMCVNPGHADEPDTRNFRFTYEVTIPAPPAGTEHLDVWVPLPHRDPGVQTISDLQISAPNEYRVTEDPRFGNRMVHLGIPKPEGEVKVSWTARITRTVDSGQGKLPTNPLYLAPTRRIPLDGKAREMAESLGTANPTLELVERARRIYNDVLDGMDYDKTIPGYGEGDFARSIEVCKGNCTDFHARFIGIGRASNIPVRFTMGIPLKPGRSSYNSYHCWAHWHDGLSWKPVDISEADKVVDKDPNKARWYFGNLGHDRIGLTFGSDITLSPPQKGAPLNYFVFPYAEADGRKVKLDKSHWIFRWEDLPS